MSGFVDEGWAAGVIYLDFSKVFNTVSPNILVSKLGCCSVGNWTTSWVKKTGWMVRVRWLWLMGHTLPGGWYRGFLQEFVLFNSFINVPEEEVEYMLFNADDHKLGGCSQYV